MPIFRDKELLQSLVDVVDVHQAWDSDLVLTGIPPFIKQIQELHIIREEQKTMVECVVEGVMDKVVEFFETRKIGGGEWTEKRMKELVGGLISTEFSTFETRVRKHVQDLADSFAESTGKHETGHDGHSWTADEEERCVNGWGVALRRWQNDTVAQRLRVSIRCSRFVDAVEHTKHKAQHSGFAHVGTSGLRLDGQSRQDA